MNETENVIVKICISHKNIQTKMGKRRIFAFIRPHCHFQYAFTHSTVMIMGGDDDDDGNDGMYSSHSNACGGSK